MTTTPWWPLRSVVCACLLLCGRPLLAQTTNEMVDDKPPSFETLQRQLAEEQARLGELKRAIQQQEARLNDMRRALGMGTLDDVRGAGAPGAGVDSGTATGTTGDAASQMAQNGQPGQPLSLIHI